MSKAEDRALEVYPKIIKRYRKLGDMKENTGSEYDENLKQRAIYIRGYHQAEKDLELTCDDINIIINAFLDYKIESVKSGKDKKYTDKEYCKEVLKRFIETKKVD